MGKKKKDKPPKAPKVSLGEVRTITTVPAPRGWSAVLTAVVEGELGIANYPVALWAHIEVYLGSKAGWQESLVGMIPFEDSLVPADFLDGFLGYQDPDNQRDFTDVALAYHQKMGVTVTPKSDSKSKNYNLASPLASVVYQERHGSL